MSIQLPSTREIAKRLGGVVSGQQVFCPGPGHSPQDRSLSVKLSSENPDGFVTYSFASDDPRDCRDHVRDRLGLERFSGKRARPVYADIVRRSAQRERERCTERNLAVVRKIWNQAVDGKGTLAEIYLASRGIRLGNWPATLRFLPASPPRYRYPAMVAAFGIPSEPEPGTIAIATDDVKALQLTYLRSDGSGKADTDPAKRTIGKGCVLPIVVAASTDSLGLVIAEGIEDALSLHMVTGLAVWAAGGAERMPPLADVVPKFIESVTIAVDDNPAGRNGSARLRDALLEHLPHVNVVLLDLAKKGRAV